MDKKRILIVEDDAPTREMLCSMLSGEGYEVLEADTGGLGLSKAFSEAPDLIVMDVMLPQTSGYDATSAIKSDPKTQGIPILMLTVKNAARDIERGLAAGANHYMSKPFSPAEFLAKVRDLLGKGPKRARK